MITLTRLDGRETVVNCDLIMTVESIPDTVLNLNNGERILVKEPVADVVKRAIAYQRRVHGPFEEREGTK